MVETKVVISGITGKMGLEAVAAISREDDLILAGGTCAKDRGSILTTPKGDVPLSTDLCALLEQTHPDVMVDFTNAGVAMDAAAKASSRKINIVMGASGFSEDQLQQLDDMANYNGLGIIVAPNFALGAVVLKKLAEQAAPHFDYVDIVESHHEAKIDSPSGFALALMRSLGENKQFTRNQPEKENLANTRGGEHNGISVRSCYMPGVVRCIRDVVGRPGLVIGLENVLGL